MEVNEQRFIMVFIFLHCMAQYIRKKFPKIEDLVEELSAELGQKGFAKVDSRDKEAVRYAKINSSINFQVGIEQNFEEEEEPEFNHIYLVVEYINLCPLLSHELMSAF